MHGPPSLPPLTATQARRNAGSTIAGYQYQFELTVANLLALDAKGTLRVEGIEDIDIWDDFPAVVQVKYYESQKWSLSSIRDAVHEFLKSFTAGLDVTYTLHLYCKNGDNVPNKLSLDQLKKCLTKKPINKPPEILYKDINDVTLIKFIEKFQICTGVSLEELKRSNSSFIAQILNCDFEEAEILHRMRAVQFINEIAIKKSESQRILNRSQLIDYLSIREIIYNKWHKEIIGIEKFINSIVRNLKESRFNNSNIHRGILLELRNDNLHSVCNLALEIASDMNGKERFRTRTSKPWTLILQGNESLVMDVKKFLIRNEISINDGYETIEFSERLFLEPAMVRTSGRTDKLEKLSYQIRIVSEESINKISVTESPLHELISLPKLKSQHINLVKNKPIQLHEISTDQLNSIIKKVIK